MRHHRFPLLTVCPVPTNEPRNHERLSPP
jgi:hypothetical protein